MINKLVSKFTRQQLFALLATGFFLFICWIIIRADLGQSVSWAKTLRQLPFGDKFGHLILYGILTFLVNLALFNRRIRLFSRSLLIGSLLVGSFAILEEFTQIALVSRNFEWYDILCDLIGIAVASYLVLRLERRLNDPKPFFLSNE